MTNSRIQHMIPRFYRLFVLLAGLGILTGCSELEFAGERALVPEQDPRENIVLTNLSTQITSGGLVQQKITGKEAVFSQSANDLIIRDVTVTAVGSDQEVRSITKADLGQIYFADRPAEQIGRRDMKFSGDVLYRTPQKDDPTTDSMQMMSELILWVEAEGKFKSPYGYEMYLLPKGRQAIRQSGKGFEAAQDLSRFVVRTGSLTTNLDADPAVERARLESEFEVIRQDVEQSARDRAPLPTPMIPPTRSR